MKEAKNTPKKELEKSYYKRTKEKLIEYKGGQVCGYNKCASALEFHHLHRKILLSLAVLNLLKI